jgi:hypothetical protein
MKQVTLPPSWQDDSDKSLEAHAVTIRRTGPFYWDREKVYVVKVGRRVFFSQEHDTDARRIEYANVALGIKTAARAFQDALDGKVVTLKRGVESAYVDTDQVVLGLQKTGRRIAFVAPCGASGYMTVAEAEKLVALLRGW